ncbi:MAG: PspC domain-containing protein [Oscillospiraceae bacterium]|nr:PspC domain-containing protein [Oscillospiraceae bacterium]
MSRLCKKKKGKMLAGVCNGIAEHLEIDVSLIRMGWILFILLGGSGILAYIIAAIIIPSEEKLMK